MPSNSITSPKYKDSVFRMLFNDKKELLSLYNALTGKNYTDTSDLEITTLEDVIYITMKNGLVMKIIISMGYIINSNHALIIMIKMC